jgi:hypothetical protein
MPVCIEVVPTAVVLNIKSSKQYILYLNEALYICSNFQVLVGVYFKYNTISTFESV